MRLKDFVKGVLALIFLAFLVALVWVMFTSMIKVFGDSTSTVEPTVVVAIVSGLGAIIVNAISKSSERKSQIFIKSKDKMAPIYEAFLNELNSSKTNEDSLIVFEKYQNVFAVNSSDNTYIEFCKMKKYYKTNKNFDRFIVAVRNELKVSNKKNKTVVEKAK